jgi:hypothetical protein
MSSIVPDAVPPEIWLKVIKLLRRGDWIGKDQKEGSQQDLTAVMKVNKVRLVSNLSYDI